MVNINIILGINININIILGMVIINIARVDIKLPRQLKTASEKHVAAQIFSMAEVVVF